MDIKGTTRVCGLIGNPVGHSVSPAIHNNLARLTGKDMVYTTFKVEKGDVASAVRGAYSLNILGLNVTVPHKSEVIDSLVDIDPLAKAIGAVNTLVRVDGGFKDTTLIFLDLLENLKMKELNWLILRLLFWEQEEQQELLLFFAQARGQRKFIC